MSQRVLGEEHLKTSVVDGFSEYMFCMSIGLRGWVLKYKKEGCSQNHFLFPWTFKYTKCF